MAFRHSSHNQWRAYEAELPEAARCKACGSKRRRYSGLIPHDMRRSAAKALRAAGVPESVVMAIGGWKTASTFRAIVSSADQHAAVEMLERAREARMVSGMVSGAVPATTLVQ